MSTAPVRLRESFGAKIALALLGTVGLILGVTLFSVRNETRRQTEAVTQRATEDFRNSFTEFIALQQQTLSRSLDPIANSNRVVAALESALESGSGALADEVAYQLDVVRISDVDLQVYTDEYGDPVLTLLGNEPVPGTDPARIIPLVDELFDDGLEEVSAFRMLQGRLYTISLRPLEIGERFVGVAAFGLEVGNAFTERLAGLVGGEVCLAAGDTCIAGTRRVREELGPVLASLPAVSHTLIAEASNERWAIIVDPLTEASPGAPRRIAAIPLGPILEPLERVSSVLRISGGAALALALLISLTLARSLSHPVRRLMGAVGRVAGGDLDVTVESTSHDELGRLATAFNEMTAGLRLKEQYRGVLDKVVSREVAEELLSGDVELGGESRPATVLFADIRGFTSLTEGMDPEQVISLINACMSRLSAAVDDHGGIVDKYVGDELMAVFGAPVSRGDDAARAVRAALDMQAAIAEWNAEREIRGDRSVGLGIGINSGEVVAGNMGSANRLNYTVLGEAVNLAARLCGSAPAGAVWVSEDTLTAAGGDFDVEAVGGQSFKGFSSEREVFRVTGNRLTSMLVTLLSGAVLFAVGGSALAVPLQAQDQGDWPTFADLGLGYISPSGFFQFDLSGRLDMEYYVTGEAPPGLIPETNDFAAGRLRLFGDYFVGDRIFGTFELRVDRGEEPVAGDLDVRIEQAFVRVQPTNWDGLQIQAGKMASLFGEYALRHRTEQDPFIRPPLVNDYRTVMPATMGADAAEAFLDWKNHGEARAAGSPVIWAVPYQWTVAALGGAGPLGYRLALTNSAPASPPLAWEWSGRAANLGASPVVGLSLQASPSLQISASWTQGPFLAPGATNLHSDQVFSYYEQEIVSAGVAWLKGPASLRFESFFERWKVPRIEPRAKDVAFYIEGQVDLMPGLWVAGRFNRIDFLDLDIDRPTTLPGPDDLQWDYDVNRLQLAVGYRLARNAELRAEYDWTTTAGPRDPSDNLLSVQWWWAF
jgi:adenylate cyclase